MKHIIAATMMVYAAFAGTALVGHSRLDRPTGTKRGALILAGLTVDARSANPGAEGFARAACVGFDLSGGSGYECGDLQVGHMLPTTREYSRDRTPILLYNSATARPHPVVGAFVSTPSSTTADSITASLVVSGTTVATTQFAGSAWGSGGVTRKIALTFDGTSDSTGIYHYALNITAKISGQYYTTSDTGSIVIINRSASKYGAGWWLASHERFYIQSDNSFLWVGGDGSWLHYTGNHYGTETVNGAMRQDSIVYISPYYARNLPTGGMVWYDMYGQLRQTSYYSQNTTYTMNTNGVVTLISLPPTGADSVLKYSLSYDGNGNLSQVTSPGLTPAQNPKRHTYMTVGSDGRLTQIMDPDSLTTGFIYSGSSKLLVGRIDKRADTLSFAYDSALKISQVSRPLNASQTAVRTFCAAEMQGLIAVNCSAGPMDSSYVATQVTGPRTDVSDSTKIWVTRTGAPRKTVDALGDTTLIAYGDSRFPSLPTKAQYADGRIVETWYNSRALTDSTTDLSNCISGTCATTRFQWDSVLAKPTKITRPSGDSTLYSYDQYYGYGLGGNLLWQEDGLGSTGRTTYSYTSVTLVSAISHPSPGGTDSVYYDAFGNVDSTYSAEGRASTMSFNLAGGVARREKSATNGGSFAGNLVFDTTTFDAMARPVWTRTRSIYSGHDSTVVRTVYDAEGNVTAVTRKASRVSDSLLTRSTFDKANRKVTDIATDGAVDSLFYDEAGNTTTAKSRRGYTLLMTYDALNRLSSRIIPSVTYDSVRSGLAVLQPTGGDTANTVFPRYPNATGWQYVVPTDTQRFTYDAVGRLLTAKNRAARVTRTYASSGLLASERQQIMTWGGTGADSNYNAHDYTLSYGYDLDSRRTSIQHPSQLLPRDAARTIGSTTSYAYDSKTGNVTTITDLFGQTHRYVYAPRGDVDSVFHSAVAYGSSAPVTEVRSYTLDGDVSSIRVLSPLDSIVVGASFLTYDDSHRLASGFGGTATYSDLGNATYSEMSGLVPNGAGVWPYWYSCESFHYDGLGNTTSSSSVTSIGSPCSTPSDSATYIYQLGTARLDRVKDSTSVLRNSYDSAGNLQFQYSDSLPSSYPGSYSYTDAQDRYTYYGADDRIMASDARWAAVRLAYTSHPYDSLQTAFEEYRYDALGRRVEVRARKYCASGMGMICRTGTIRRTVWDGDQELHEITMPGDDGVSAAELENDTLAVTRSFPYASGGSGDQDPRHLFGRELYVFGQSIDAPVAIIRSNFVTSWTYASANDSSWVFRPRTILPVYGSGGTLVNSYFAENGVTSWGEYEPTMGSGVGMYTTGGGVRLAYGSVVSPTSNYLGTLLVDKRDDVGTFYRRNRSYDPIIGRFTQEDPLGLIGGLNIYAYAGGDPINNTDPSGLTTMQICTQCQSGDDGSQETYEQGPIPHSSAAGGTCTNLMQDDDATGGPRDDSRTDDPECTYHQGSGILICQAPSGETRQAKGYSGQPPYKNDPSAQNLSNQGPIPQGCYTWGPALNGGGNHKNLKGPVIPITPCTGTNTFGRDLFRFHGDDGHGTASTGCIVIGHDFRSWLSGFGHGRLTVVP